MIIIITTIVLIIIDLIILNYEGTVQKKWLINKRKDDIDSKS